MSGGSSARRGRPRDAAVDERVLDAAQALLLAHGYGGLSVDQVAERAGVAKTTLYRRWPTKDHLAVTVAARILGDVPIPDTGDVRRDLAEFIAGMAESLNRVRAAGRDASGDDRSAGLLAELVGASARHADIGELVRGLYAQRRAIAFDRIRKACVHEGLRDDLDPVLIIDQLAGPIYYRVLVIGMPVDRDYAERLVAAVLDGAFTQTE